MYRSPKNRDYTGCCKGTIRRVPLRIQGFVFWVAKIKQGVLEGLLQGLSKSQKESVP